MSCRYDDEDDDDHDENDDYNIYDYHDDSDKNPKCSHQILPWNNYYGNTTRTLVKTRLAYSYYWWNNDNS